MDVLSAPELLDALVSAGVTLVPDQDGQIQCLAPKGALTPRLRGQIRHHKAALLLLLAERHQRRAADAQEPAPSLWRRWVAGGTPGQFGTYKVDAPMYHDTPSPTATYWGELCAWKACQKLRPDATQSLRYFPSGMCVTCWQRADKAVTKEEESA